MVYHAHIQRTARTAKLAAGFGVPGSLYDSGYAVRSAARLYAVAGTKVVLEGKAGSCTPRQP